MYAANGPEKDILRGVVSQSPLLRLVNPPAKPVLFVGGLVSKFLPNFQLYKPVPVCSVSLSTDERAKIFLEIPRSQKLTMQIPSYTAQERYLESTQWLQGATIWCLILL